MTEILLGAFIIVALILMLTFVLLATRRRLVPAEAMVVIVNGTDQIGVARGGNSGRPARRRYRHPRRLWR